MLDFDCPFCKHSLSIPVSWIKQNERAFCDSCCKSFEVKIQEDVVAEEKSDALNEGKLPSTDDYDWTFEGF